MLDGFVQPRLPENFDLLDPEARKAAKDLYAAQLFWLSYEIEVQRAIPEFLRAFHHRDSLLGHILGMIGSIYDGSHCQACYIMKYNGCTKYVECNRPTLTPYFYRFIKS